MAKHFFDPPADDFAAKTELLRGANRLPTLSDHLRERVLNAATIAYRQARRCALARQAASFLSACLLASFVLSPLTNMSFPEATWERLAQSSADSLDFSVLQPLSSPKEPNSAWSLRHDREILDMPNLKSQISNLKSERSDFKSNLIAHVEPSTEFPRDKLLTTLRASDDWGTVQAFQAVRSRSHSTLQRAFAAN
jgi:hypothetical protein